METVRLLTEVGGVVWLQVLLYSQNQLKTLLLNAAENVNMWLCKVRKMKAVYHHLNMFYVDVSRNCFVGEYWVPTKFLDEVTTTIHESAVSDDAVISGVAIGWAGWTEYRGPRV